VNPRRPQKIVDSSESDYDPTPPPRPGQGVGPIALLLPLSTLLLALLWVRHQRGGEDAGRPEPPAAVAERSVDGWVGTLETVPGVPLNASLTPLHDDPLRQAFDRDVLAERRGHETGQAWRLALDYGGGEDGGSAPPALELDPLAVRDAAGSELVAAVRQAPSPAKGGLADPLRALLAVPATLEPGEELIAVLWGEPPSEGMVLIVGPHELELLPGVLPVSVVSRTLARLDSVDEGGRR